MKCAEEIMEIMKNIEYGFKDEEGFNIINNTEKWDNDFYKFYYLQSPEELLKSKCGVCWDMVELERNLFKNKNIPFKTYFIYTDENEKPSHTFLVFNEDKYYWFEKSWNIYQGIHEYANLNELLTDVKNKFIEFNNTNRNSITYIYEYQKPKDHITCEEFYDYIDSQKLIKI